MRSCAIIVIASIILAGIGVGLAFVFSGQMRAGFCFDQPFRVAVGISVGLVSILILGALLLSLVNQELLGGSLNGGQVALGAILLSVIGMGISTYVIYNQARTTCPSIEIYRQLSPVCQGQGVSLAGTRANEYGSLHLLVLGEDGNPIPWTTLAREEWKPESVEDVDLVLCVQPPEEILVGTCPSALGAKVERYEQRIMVRLMEANSGREIKAGEISAQPPVCPQSRFEFATRIKAAIEFGAVRAWVEQALSVAENDPAINPAVTATATFTAAPPPTATILSSPTPSPAPPLGVVRRNARLRAEPSTESATLAGLLTGEQVQVLGVNAARTWVKVISSQGQEGWVFAELLELNLPLADLTLIP